MSSYVKIGKNMEYDNAPDWLVAYMQYRRTILGNTPQAVKTFFLSTREFCQWASFFKSTGRHPKNEEELRSVDLLEFPLETVTSFRKNDILTYLHFLTDNLDNSPATRNKKLSALSSLYNYILDNQEELGVELLGNPTSRIPKAKGEKKKPVYFTAAEVEQFLCSIAGENAVRDIAIYVLFFSSGIRISEAVGIDMKDINMQARTIRIRGKGQAERLAHITEPCYFAIQRYLEEYRNLIQGLSSPALFVSKRKMERLTTEGIEKNFRKQILAAGLGGKGLTPHKCRHTTGTIMAQDGIDLQTIQAVLGHRNPATTEIYTHLDNAMIARTVDKSAIGKIDPYSINKKEELR